MLSLLATTLAEEIALEYKVSRNKDDDTLIRAFCVGFMDTLVEHGFEGWCLPSPEVAAMVNATTEGITVRLDGHQVKIEVNLGDQRGPVATMIFPYRIVGAISGDATRPKFSGIKRAVQTQNTRDFLLADPNVEMKMIVLLKNARESLASLQACT